MRLSDAELQWMQTRLAQRYAAAGREAQETLERKLAALPPDQLLLTSWCYAASPLSDWANYDFSLFSACAAHALFLREQSPEVRALPEQLRRAEGDVPVRRAVEAVAPHPVLLIEGVGDTVEVRVLGYGLVEGRIEHGDLRNALPQRCAPSALMVRASVAR